jgi:hypothetical protein
MKVRNSLFAVFGLFLCALGTREAKAQANLSLNGTVPSVTTLDLAWANPHIALKANTGTSVTVTEDLAALNIYDNTGQFTITATSSGTNPGFLTGPGTSKIAYTLQLQGQQLPTTTAAAFANGGTPVVNDTSFAAFTTGVATLFQTAGGTAPYDSQSEAGNYVYLVFQSAAFNSNVLMAGAYADTLNVTITSP